MRIPRIGWMKVKKLGLSKMGQVQVRYADARIATQDTVEVYLELVGRHGVITASVEPIRRPAVIGGAALEDLDYLIDIRHQRLVLRDAHFVVHEIELSGSA